MRFGLRAKLLNPGERLLQREPLVLVQISQYQRRRAGDTHLTMDQHVATLSDLLLDKVDRLGNNRFGQGDAILHPEDQLASDRFKNPNRL